MSKNRIFKCLTAGVAAFLILVLLTGGSLISWLQGVWLAKVGGVHEENGIFITENALIENITCEDDAVLEANIAGIEQYLDNDAVHAVVALIPTAAAIRQEELPTRAELLNQKALIAQVYEAVSGHAGTADTYLQLFSARTEQIYCRTASNLTALGGYYVYSALAPRLGLSAREIDDFEIENLSFDYYGDLCERVPDVDVTPDLLSLYRYTRSARTYSLYTVRDDETKIYHTLFPEHLAQLGREKDAILGGTAQVREITACAPEEPTLLIFSDDTALSYLPFLATHYRKITSVDPRYATYEQLASINPEQYDRVLIACSVKTILQEKIFSNLITD